MIQSAGIVVIDWKNEEPTVLCVRAYGSGKKSKTATYFLADRISDKEPYLPINPELGKPENDEYRWVPVSHIDNLLPSRLLPVMTFIEDWVHDNEKT